MVLAELLCIEVESDSLADAVEEGIKQFDCSRSDLEAEIVQTPSSGWFGLFGRRQMRVAIRLVDRNAAAMLICQKLLDLAGLPAAVSCESALAPCRLVIDSPEPSLLIGRSGQTLDALQFLLNSMLDKQFGPEGKVELDVGGYRLKRKSELNSLAKRLVKQARETGKPAATPPLSVDDRKVLHGFFARENDIHAQTKGQGNEKKLVVSTGRR